MPRRRTFEVTEMGLVNPAEIRADYPHMIWPCEIGIDDPPIKAEVLRFQCVEDRRFGVMLFRVYTLPEHDGTQLILSQHLSELVGPKMGSTALLLPSNEKLAIGEQNICRFALERLLMARKSQR